MAFQTPIGVPLTDTQENLLSQLSSLKGFLAIPDKKSKNIPKERQISTFDYLLRLTESTIGAAFIDVMLKEFISKLFDPNSSKLENAIIKSLAKSLDAQGKTISNSESNLSWLQSNVLPGLRVTFLVAKAIIAKKIITMIFGPKEKMDTDPVKQTQALNACVCSEGLFSISNDTSDTAGDVEFNTIELKKRLEKGQVIFTISCQDVKISLPANIDATFDDVINNNSNPSKAPINPAVFFDVISNHVGTETQRINSPANNNAVKKGFLQIMVEKIMNLITPAMEPHLAGAIAKINSGPNGNLGITSADIISTPCEIRALCGSDPATFKKKSAFTSSISNILLAMLCAIMLQKLIKEIKKLIANALAKRAKNKIQRKVAKQKQQLAIIDSAQEAGSAVAKSGAALATLKDIFNYDKT